MVALPLFLVVENRHDEARMVTASGDRISRLWDDSRTGIMHHGPAICLAAALANGIGQRTEAEATDWTP